MTIFKFAYDPAFSDDVCFALQKHTPSMVSPNGDTMQFHIEVVDREVKLSGTDRDSELLDELRADGIDFVEIVIG
jgi:pyruvate dehydrogenase complex dehydrogenase (E1) component